MYIYIYLYTYPLMKETFPQHLSNQKVMRDSDREDSTSSQ